MDHRVSCPCDHEQPTTCKPIHVREHEPSGPIYIYIERSPYRRCVTFGPVRGLLAAPGREERAFEESDDVGRPAQAVFENVVDSDWAKLKKPCISKPLDKDL